MDDQPVYLSYKRRVKIANFEEALFQASSDALHEKVISANYLKNVMDSINESGEYMVIHDHAVIWHARPSEAVRKEFIGYLFVEEGIKYFNKTIHHIFVFGARRDDYHLQVMKHVAKMIEKIRFMQQPLSHESLQLILQINEG